MVENSKEEDPIVQYFTLPSLKEEHKTDEKHLKTVSQPGSHYLRLITPGCELILSNLGGDASEDGSCSRLAGEWLLGFYAGRDISPAAFCCS